MIFSGFGDWRNIRLIPNPRIRPCLEEDVKESQEDASEFRARILQKEIVDFIRSTRLPVFEVTEDTLELIILDTAAFEIRCVVAECFVAILQMLC